MINELWLNDFKAFHNEHIPLRPLTVLVGENNSGKSSVLAAIRLLAQTVQSTDSSIPLKFDGPFGDFGSFRDVVHGNHRGRPMTLGLTVPFQGPIPGRPSLRSARPRSVTLSAEFKYRLQRRETILRAAKLNLDQHNLLAVTRSNDGDRMTMTSAAGSAIAAAIRGQFSPILRMNNFIPTLNSVAMMRARDSADIASILQKVTKIERDIRWSAHSIVSALRAVEVIGAMREPPARTYLHSGSVGNQIGVAGENWGSFVAFAEYGRSRNNYMPAVTAWIRKAGIAKNLKVAWLSDRHFELVVEHPVTGERENISDVGRGTSQVLPVIIGGYRLNKGDTYLVEEPEIHLHPRAQAALGDYFLDLTKRGVQTVLETHSEYLLTRLQQHVAAGELSADEVVFYYVGASKEGKTLTPLTLNDDGVFEKSIPGGFFPQRMQEATSLAKARSMRSKVEDG
jgi:hypothetical protein